MSGDLYELEMDAESTVAGLKSRIASVYHIPSQLQRLACDGLALRDGDKLIDHAQRSSLSVVLIVAVNEPDVVMWLKRIAEEVQKGDARFMHAVIGCLSDEDPLVRGSAVEALGDLCFRGQRDAVSAAMPLLRDSDASVRRGAVEALGRLCEDGVVLEPFLEDEDDFVRRAAHSALEEVNASKSEAAAS
eukprot:TRINITY_DN44393_c0_g1_i1.p1 TRINITY_DN44393_c0_g1~~TRINITY_DN44393_c0_g1_i1.p1  ORF type:complete len:201 (+),score=38.84 TRINITY_DN44393_c0_g1_i1:39-605(+)